MRSLYELRMLLGTAAKQGAALAAFGVAAGCAGKSERSNGNPDEHSTGGVTNAGGSRPRDDRIRETYKGRLDPRFAAATGGGGASGGSAGSETGGRGHGGGPTLTPYPLEEIGCMGPVYDAGYVGQCCVSASCYTPDGQACIAADQGPPIPLPPGSGTCACSWSDLETPTLKGPYAPNPDGMAYPEGTCCYLVGSIGCEGRTLLVEGAVVVAPLTRRGDWCASFG